MNPPIKKSLIILVPVVLMILLIVGLVIFNNKNDSPTNEEVRGVAGDPTDITMDFLGDWLEARKSSTTDPYIENLANSNILSVEMVKKLSATELAFRESGNDPVLCQSTIPGKLRSKSIFKTNDRAKIMILPKDNQTTIIPVVTLAGHDGIWEITDITCSNGEEAPDQGEFSFNKDGYLLKSSLKPPLNNQYWHLVFEQNDTAGYTVPLFLSENSVCKLSNGSEETCRDDMFFEAQKVDVQGNMTEAGVEVMKINILN